MPSRLNELDADAKRTLSRVKKLRTRMHPDHLGDISKEEQAAIWALNELLEEIKKYPNDLDGWSNDVRAQYPPGSSVRFIGLAPDRTLRPLSEKPFPLRRPELFLAMFEAYLDTGEVPGELIADEAERHSSEEAEDEYRGSDESMRMFLDTVKNPTSLAQLIDIREAMRMYHPQTVRDAGIPQKFDAAAEKLIGAEIADGSLRSAEEHINGISFFDKQTAERLRSALAEKEQELDKAERGLQKREAEEGVGMFAQPTNATDLEKRAAKAASIGELAAIAEGARGSDTLSEKQREYARKSIDTLAKQMFAEACGKAQTIEEYETIQRQVHAFPFAQKEYGEEVRAIVGMRIKNFTDAEMIRGAKERGQNMSAQEVHTDALKEWNASPLRRFVNAVSRIIRNKS